MLDHAVIVGRILNPNAVVSPNFRWMPIAYHGHVANLATGNHRLRRPMGQATAAGAKQAVYGSCKRFDFELGIVIGPGNASGEPIAMADTRRTSSASACSTTGRRTTSAPRDAGA